MSAITSTLASSTVTASAANRPDRMANVEKALNMSSSDLRSALPSGSSLSDIATKQGVSRDDLLAAIKTDLQNRPQRPGGDGDGDGPGATDATGATSETDRLTKMANAIADRKGVEGHHRHHGHHQGGSGSGAGLTPATSSSDTVAAQLATGDGVDLQL